MIYWSLFFTFLKVGAFTFGGGYAMLPLIQEEVEAHGWMTSEQLINFVAVSESTPGPFAVNVSTYVGSEMAGVPGALCATLGVVLPSFVIILIVAGCFQRFQKNVLVQGCMKGLRPAVVGMIAAAVLSTGQTVFFPGGFSPAALGTASTIGAGAIFLLMLLLIRKKIHPIWIIVCSAVLGMVIQGWVL